MNISTDNHVLTLAGNKRFGLLPTGRGWVQWNQTVDMWPYHHTMLCNRLRTFLIHGGPSYYCKFQQSGPN